MKSLQSFQDLCLCECGLSCTTYSENFYPYLLKGRRRKWQKPLLKSEFMLFPSSLLLFHVVQFVKCWWSFLELNSKGLFLCYEKHTTSLSCVHALHKTWNKAVTARHGGAACDSIKMYKKAWFAYIVVILLTAYINTFLTFALPFSIWALSTLIHRSTRSHTTTGISMRFRQNTQKRSKTVEMLMT